MLIHKGKYYAHRDRLLVNDLANQVDFPQKRKRHVLYVRSSTLIFRYLKCLRTLLRTPLCSIMRSGRRESLGGVYTPENTRCLGSSIAVYAH